MDLLSEWIDYDTDAGWVDAYISRPAAAIEPVPAVIVIQEVWGADAHIADVTDRFASAGYVALAPDLYSAGGGRPPALAAERVAAAKEFLNTIPTGEWMAVLTDEQRRAEALSQLPAEKADEVTETIGGLFGGVGGDTARHLTVLRAAVAWLHRHPACVGRAVGSVGFCLGGGLSALLAAEEPELGAAVIFYGSSPADEQAGTIGCPVRGFYGQEDPRIVAGLPAFDAALSAGGVDHELRVYPNTGHAFFNDTRPSYRQEAARDAWAQTLVFFAETLGPVSTVEP
ncbi:MAG TPA: dienelactone hydrolase family protein [Solirubrobacteraceae bacterium]|nr:dienelactone hydrolase family protein [Solirubrobacteraceae bacterium]